MMICTANKRHQEKMLHAIQETFIELYSIEIFSKISVKNICTDLHISRTTFYKYYDDLYAVLEDIEDNLIMQLKLINKNFYKDEFSKYRHCELYDTLNFIKANSKYFKTLLSAGKGGQFIYKWKKIIKYDFNKKYETEQIHIKNKELVLEMIASAIIGVYTYWLFNIDKISIDDVAEEALSRIFKDFIKT